MSKRLIELMTLADTLTPDEQLSLISHLTQRLSFCEISPKPRRNLTELEGIAPNLLGGMDAQEYVRRMRCGEFPDLELEEMNTRKLA
jgi:hypothetical protein